MNITFDPTNAQDVAMMQDIIQLIGDNDYGPTIAQQHVPSAAESEAVKSPAPPASNVPPVPPTTGAESATGASSGQKLDSAGVPWDSRIHAQSKTKKTDGTWKSARGVDKEEAKRIEAELKAQNHPAQEAASIPTLPAEEAQASAPQAPAVPEAPQAPAVPEAGAPPVPEAGAPQAPAVPEAGGQLTFPALMKRVNAAINAGTFSREDVDAIIAGNIEGVPNLAMMALPANAHRLQEAADILGV